MMWVGIAVIVLGLVGLAVFLYRQPDPFPRPFVLPQRTTTTWVTTTRYPPPSLPKGYPA